MSRLGSLNILIYILLFVLAGVLFLHSFVSINLDIGRHIKLGEIIWQTKSVPDTNLFSFTEPDFPFINHHWLSEVAFYLINQLGGLKLIIVFKAAVLLLAYAFLFFAIRKKTVWAVAVAFLTSLALFWARTEARPEIFSYLLFAAFVFIISRERNTGPTRALWILPVLQVFWVNFHIFFFLGPLLYLFFLFEKLVKREGVKRELIVGALLGLALLINPNGFSGAVHPLHIMGNYAYGVAENEPLLNLLRFGAENAFYVWLFFISFFLTMGAVILSPKKWACRIFDFLLIGLVAAMSYKMQRNISFYALGIFPILANNPHLGVQLPSRGLGEKKRAISTVLKIGLAIILAWLIIWVAANGFYKKLDSLRRFGLGVPQGADRAVGFIKDNNISGPVFNNFEVGSFLIWKLYPEQKVFVDGRPEAYPAEFFNNVFKPMTRDYGKWQELSKKYGINYVFINHNSLPDDGVEFLVNLGKDKNWPLVFINETIAVFLDDVPQNSKTIAEHEINRSNASQRVGEVMAEFNNSDDLEFRSFGRILLAMGFFDASAGVYEKLKENLPDNPYGYQGAGLSYAAMNDIATQNKAAYNLQKAVDMGLDSETNYFTLGLVYANLDEIERAKWALGRVLEINPGNQEAKKILKIL